MRSARGWIRTSTGFPVKAGDDERQIQTTTLADELGLSRDHDIYTIFRDHRSGLEYIRSNQELWEQGLYLELDAYQYHVFLDFREVQDDPFLPYSQLCSYLNGRGVPDIEEAIKEILLQPIHVPFRELTNAGQLRWLIDKRIVDAMPLAVDPVALAEVEEKALDLLDKIKEMMTGNGDAGDTAGTIKCEIALALALPGLDASQLAASSDDGDKALSYLVSGPPGRLQLTGGEPYTWGTLLCWIFACHLGEMVSTLNSREISRTWIDEWLLTKIMAAGLIDLGLSQGRERESACVDPADDQSCRLV